MRNKLAFLIIFRSHLHLHNKFLPGRFTTVIDLVDKNRAFITKLELLEAKKSRNIRHFRNTLLIRTLKHQTMLMFTRCNFANRALQHYWTLTPQRSHIFSCCISSTFVESNYVNLYTSIRCWKTKNRKQIMNLHN